MSLYAVLLGACGQPARGPADEAPGEASASVCPAAPQGSRQIEQPRLLVQDGHTQPINLMALSGDGSLLASASLDQTLRLWDTRHGLLLRRLTAPGATNGLALDRAGQWLAYADAEVGAKPHGVRVMRLADEHVVELPKGPFALSPDGQVIAIGTLPIQIFDTATGKAMRSLEVDGGGDVHAVAFDAAGARLAAAIDASVAVFDAKTGSLQRRVALEPEPLPAASPAKFAPVMSAVYEVAFAGDDVFLKRGTGKLQLMSRDGTVRTLATKAPIVGQTAVAGRRLWTARAAESGLRWTAERAGVLESFELPSGKRRARHELPHEPFRVTVSADGSTLAVAYLHAIEGYSMRLVDASTGHVVRTIEGRDTSVLTLAMTGNGSQLAVGSQAALTMWSLPRGEMWFSTPDRQLRASRHLAYDHGGKQLAAYEVPAIRIREASSGRLLRAWRIHGGRLRLLGFRARSSLLLTLDESGTIHEWDLSGPLPPATSADADNLMRDLNKPPGKTIGTVGFRVAAAALSPDGSAIVAGADSIETLPDAGKIALIDARTGEQRWSIQSLTSFGRWLGFSAAGGKVLLSGSRHVPVNEMKPGQTGEPILRAFAADSGAAEGEVTPPTAGPLAARGDLVVIGGSRPTIVDTESLKTRAEIALRDAHVRSVLAHPTKDAFLLGGIGGSTALVTTDGKLQALLISTPGGDYIATTPAGAYRASLDGTRRLAWTFRKPLEAFSFEQFASRFDRPDAIAKRLAGEPSPRLPTVSRPPRVTLQGQRRRASQGPKVTVRASVQSPGQVDRVRVFVNGRLAAEQLVCAPEGQVEIDVPLQPGENRLAVVAYDSDGFSSNPELVDVVSRAKGHRPELWIVAVGVSAYPKLASRYQLQFADDDARAMAASLERLAGPQRPFSKARKITLIDDQVTVASIERALASLAEMKAHDLAVVFLAGHGLRLEGGKMHFLTHQASLKRAEVQRSAMGWDRLERALGTASGRVVMLLDACHSGHVTTEPVAPNEELAKALAEDDRTGVLVFAASRGSQLSYEVGGAEGAGSRGLELAWEGSQPKQARGLAKRHGLFTSAMLEALAGKAPDRDRSGATELGEFIDYVTERVRGASNGQQTPWVARRELFGDFPFAPTSASAGPSP